MLDDDTKNNVISFRLSGREYKAIEQISRRQGFPSVSLFARSVTMACESSATTSVPREREIEKLWSCIHLLGRALEQLVAQARVALAGSASGSGATNHAPEEKE
jgi:hypothetical protein